MVESHKTKSTLEKLNDIIRPGTIIRITFDYRESFYVVTSLLDVQESDFEDGLICKIESFCGNGNISYFCLHEEEIFGIQHYKSRKIKIIL